MTDLKDYLDPVSIDKPCFPNMAEEAQFGRSLTVNTENYTHSLLDNRDVAIVGLPDDIPPANERESESANAVREKLYSLSRLPGRLRITDLGNMKRGASHADTIAGLTDLLSVLRARGVLPLLMGGSSSLIASADDLCRREGVSYTLASVDSRIDYNPASRDHNRFNYLARLRRGDRPAMGHYINVGYQTYLNDPQVVNLMRRSGYELLRLGEVREAIHQAEPLFRDSDIVMIDMGAVRQSDAPGTPMPSPNGLYGEEISLLAHYAGLSDRISLFTLFEVNCRRDVDAQTASLAAQTIWLFLESYTQRQAENPSDSETANGGRFTRYHVTISDLGGEMVFVKSNFTERWWVEVTRQEGEKGYLACSYDDYLKANANEVPERWLRVTKGTGR